MGDAEDMQWNILWKQILLDIFFHKTLCCVFLVLIHEIVCSTDINQRRKKDEGADYDNADEADREDLRQGGQVWH